MPKLILLQSGAPLRVGWLPFFHIALVALFFCVTLPLLAQTNLVLDRNVTGRTFEGIGAASAGASSRLLIDYPEPQRSQILDYLFKPNYGAALQHLKVEIGGEINSTDGTEPTHQRTATETNYNRGYEWWLMQQAAARNPGIALDCLAWGAPGWIGGGNYYSQDMCNYIVNFLKAAQSNYGLNIGFTGTHNEAGMSTTTTTWFKLLRSTLNSNGLANVKLVVADEWGGTWNIVTNKTYGLLVDAALSNIVDRVGVHYPGQSSPAAAQTCGKILWSSEDGIGGSTWSAAMKLAKIFNRNYITGKMTATEIWSPITSYYDILAAADSGLMRANTPWSGNYLVAPAIWAAAHTTQFAAPGWTYLEGGASALLPAGGSVVTLKSTNNLDYSIVVETSDATVAQTVTFRLTNGLSTATLNVWQTTQSSQFINVGTVTPVSGNFSYTFQPAAIYTLTTTTGQAKGGAVPPAVTPFPLPFQDTFESYAAATTPKFFSDQAGTFETFTRTDGQGRDLRQVSPQTGLRWAAEWQPYTLIGDATWTDYDVSAYVMSEPTNGLAFVMGRVGSVPGFSNPLPLGYWLAINYASSQWELHTASNLLASGAVSTSTNGWHLLRLAMSGSSLICFVDNVRVASVADSTYASGMAGLGCGGWYGAQFDNFTLRPAHGSDPDLGLAATASASSVWQADSVTYAAGKINDNNSTTRWNSAFPTLANEWLELDWPLPVTFNRTAYAEYGSRIAGYQIQHWNGSSWIVDVNGSTIGSFDTDIFPTITSTKVRLVMTNFTSTPSVYQFSVYNDSNIATNQALAATATASSIWSSTYTAAMANDNNFNTRWNSALGQTNNQWIELDWPAPVTYNRTFFTQLYNRILAYKIQHWNGSAWLDDASNGPAASGQTDSFPAVTASRMRLLMISNSQEPSIWELQVYNDPASPVPVTINEWMLNNTRTLADPAGGFQSWFELYNSGAASVNLAGYLLGGAAGNLFQFQIPGGYTLAPGGFLLVWADGQTSFNTGSGDLHVNFTLPSASAIALTDPAGNLVDIVNLSAQAADVSSGSRPDGDPVILNLPVATPRRSNNQTWATASGLQKSSGSFQIPFTGIPFTGYRVLACTNLASPAWNTVASLTSDGLGNFKFADTNLSGVRQRFYRSVTP